MARWIAPLLLVSQFAASFAALEPWNEPDTLAERGRAEGLSALLSNLASNGAPPATLGEILQMPPGLGLLEGFFGSDLTSSLPPRWAGELTERLLPRDVEPLPLPRPPAGPEPLLQALRVYASTQSVELPDLAVLRATIRLLELTPHAERALAQLLLAYCQSVDIERAALSRLTPADWEFLQGTTETRAAWFAADPTRTNDDYESALISLAAQRIDLTLSMQAADLMVRAVDATRHALADPARAPAADADVADLTPTDVPTEPVSRLAAISDPSTSPWAAAEGLVAAVLPTPTHSLRPMDPRTTLESALSLLATSYGFESFPTSPGVDTLPPSLSHAIAVIVAAQAQGVETRDSAVQAHALLEAVRFAEPTLRAWASLLRVGEGSWHDLPDARSLVATTLTYPTEPSMVVASALGADTDARPTPTTLVEQLTLRGITDRDATRATNELGPRLATALATILAAESAVESARNDILSGLTPRQQAALMATPSVQRLLGEPIWTPPEAALIETWSDATRALGAQSTERLHNAQSELVAAVEAAAQSLTAPQPASHDPMPTLPLPPLPVATPTLPVPVPTVPAMTTPAVPPVPPLPLSCPTIPGFSECEKDVWFRAPQGGGILITGPRASSIDLLLAGGDPRISIDLGGDDVYFTSAGSATGGFLPMYTPTQWLGTFETNGLTGRTFDILLQATPTRPVAVTLDVGGDDQYRSPHDLAQGAAAGFGALGILYDALGNDEYEHQPPASTFISRGAQGFGTLGGVGVLIDVSGTDRYTAPITSGQGAAINPMMDLIETLADVVGTENPITPTTGGIGLLVDLGFERDTFLTKTGQGFGRGEGSLGFLFDAGGDSEYTTSQPGRVEFQGGATGRIAVGILVDLGGRDTYSNLDLAQDATLVPPPTDDVASKGNDRVWIQDTPVVNISDVPTEPANVGIGIDLSAGDDDGDLYPNLVEMSSGSDPQDHSSTPSATGAVGAAVALVESQVGAVLDAIENLDTTDPDEDGFPTSLEQVAGSDPEDADSTPVARSNNQIVEENRCVTPIPGVVGHPPGAAPCFSVLVIGGPGSSTYNTSALVSIDLGGPDQYNNTVAGTTLLALDGRWSFGQVAIDLEGNDRYETPGLDATQGSALRGGASFLIDLAGEDLYHARANAQGAAGPEAGIGFLIDLGGDDHYVASTNSQGFSTQGSTGGLIDTDGNDHYTSDTQAFGRERSVDADEGDLSPITLGAPGTALLFDGGGNDHYTSVTNDVRLRFDPADPRTVFATQGNALPDDFYQGNAYFLEQSTTDDEYRMTDVDGELTDVSHLKNGMVDVTAQGRHNQAGGETGPQASTFSAVRAFLDDVGALNADPDEDGVPTLFEILVGSAPNDAGSNPGNVAPVFSVLEEASVPDPAFDESGEWLHVEPLGPASESILSPGHLGLPGLSIGGRTDTIHERPVVFLVDLGGDDVYKQAYAGGMSPDLHALYRGDRQLGGEGSATLGAYVGAFAPSGVSLLLDISPDEADPGDDLYAPERCVVDQERTDADVSTYNGQIRSGPNVGNDGLNEIPPLVVCPSLGGAFAGVALLADDGGVNTFESALDVSFAARSVTSTSRAAGLGYAVSQGAGYLGGVGVLTTWNAVNTFDTDVAVQASELRAGPRAVAAARGVTQGAGWGGVGILAAFGDGDDTYRATTTASVPADNGPDATQAADIAQGATQDGIGILFDTGGNNSYSALRGFAQGYAGSAYDNIWNGPAKQGSRTKPLVGSIVDTAATDSVKTTVDTAMPFLGLLWSGDGNDKFVAEAYSQGSSAGTWGPLLTYSVTNASQDTTAVGLLLEGGGSDTFSIVEAPEALSRLQCPINQVDYPRRPACALSQGAAAQGGTGVILDLSGDDQYLAPARTSVQGAAHLGYGAVFDLSGNDVYRAGGKAQGYATVDDDAFSRGAAHVGLLADLGGNDYYQASEFALGFGQLRAGDQAAPVGLFVDGGGPDVYEYAAIARNGGQWVQGTGAGVDAAFDHQALVLLQGVLDAAVPLSVRGNLTVFATTDPQDFTGASMIMEDQVTSGDIYLVARFEPAQGAGDESVRRLSFALDGKTVGQATFVPEVSEPSVAVFRLPLQTAPTSDDLDDPFIPDGDYDVSATVFLDHGAPPGGVTWAPATSPDLTPYTVVMDWPISIDNPPVARFSVSGSIVAPPDQTVVLHADVIQDYPSSDVPSAFLEVRLRPTANPSVFVRQYGPLEINDGAIDVAIDGMCGTVRCPDGRYLLEVDVRDAAGNQPLCAPACTDLFEIVIDSTAPVSEIDLPAFSNRSKKAGASGLEIAWTASDDRNEVGAHNVAGLRDITILKIDAEGKLLEDLGVWDIDDESIDLPNLAEGETVRLISVATDNAGWSESPCLAMTANTPPETEPCYRAKLLRGEFTQTVIDFILPSLDPCHPISDERTSCDPGPRISKPGVVGFHVNATDAGTGTGPGSGLGEDAVTIDIDGATHSMTNLDGTHYVFAWDTGARPSDERPYSYTIVATDQAGNARSRTFTGYLDSLAPRIATPLLSFRVGNVEFPEAKPGSVATFNFRIDDLVGSAVTAWLDATAVQGPSRLDCTTDPNAADAAFWTCSVALPSSLSQEGSPYAVIIHAVDEAGNEATRSVPVSLVATPPGITDVRITGIGHSNLTVRWHTSVATTGQILFGATSQLGRSSPRVDAFETDHELELRGLAPSTTYFIAVQSVGRSGIPNVSAPIQIRTSSAYVLSLPAFPAGTNISGLELVTVRIDSLTTGVQPPVRVTARVQDAESATSPTLVDAFQVILGDEAFEFNTTSLPDGAYVLLLDALRLGDRQSLRSPVFYVDNTFPVLVAKSPFSGDIVNEANTPIRFEVTDFGASRSPDVSTLLVTVDGRSVQATVDDLVPHPTKPDSATMSVLLEEPLEDGPHTILVGLSDLAQNEGILNLSLIVDTTPPAVTQPLEFRLGPNQTHARPGGPVNVTIGLTDANGVASAFLDLGPFGGKEVPLIERSRDTWAASVTLPRGIAGGTKEIPVVALDRAGTRAVVAMLNITVDAIPPKITHLDASNSGFTTGTVRVSVDEPSRIVVRVDGTTRFDSVTPLQSTRLNLTGLRPSSTHIVEVDVVDAAGNRDEKAATLLTPIDDAPASPVNDLTATSQNEGEVTLTWGPAHDNAGIESYVIERLADGNASWTLRVPANQTTGTDPDAPAGKTVTYRVYAADLGGNAGTPNEASVRVAARPHLVLPMVNPMVGQADEPFAIRVTYVHAAGIDPDAVFLVVEGKQHKMQREGNGSCAQGCVYETNARLPPTILGDEQPNVSFLAQVGELNATTELKEPPLVLADDVQPGGSADGSSWALGTCAVLALGMFLRRRKVPA